MTVTMTYRTLIKVLMYVLNLLMFFVTGIVFLGHGLHIPGLYRWAVNDPGMALATATLFLAVSFRLLIAEIFVFANDRRLTNLENQFKGKQ